MTFPAHRMMSSRETEQLSLAMYRLGRVATFGLQRRTLGRDICANEREKVLQTQVTGPRSCLFPVSYQDATPRSTGSAREVQLCGLYLAALSESFRNTVRDITTTGCKSGMIAYAKSPIEMPI